MTITDTRSRWLALLVLCLGDLMIVLDGTIVNVALPSIRDDLGFSQESLAWVVNAYLLTFGGFLLLGGRLGDLFGHRRLFLSGITPHARVARLRARELAGSARRGTRGPGLGGAIVSAVALSLIMTLFTSPQSARRRWVCSGSSSRAAAPPACCSAGHHGRARLALIFLVNLPVGGRLRPEPGAPARRAGACDRPGRRRRRIHGDHVADAGGLRHRERQRGGVDVAPDARPPRSRGGAPRPLPARGPMTRR